MWVNETFVQRKVGGKKISNLSTCMMNEPCCYYRGIDWFKNNHRMVWFLQALVIYTHTWLWFFVMSYWPLINPHPLKNHRSEFYCFFIGCLKPKTPDFESSSMYVVLVIRIIFFIFECCPQLIFLFWAQIALAPRS